MYVECIAENDHPWAEVGGSLVSRLTKDNNDGRNKSITLLTAALVYIWQSLRCVIVPDPGWLLPPRPGGGGNQKI